MATRLDTTGVSARAPSNVTAPTRRRAPRRDSFRDRRDAPAAPAVLREEDPGTYPQVYASTCVGGCMEPELRDGCTLVFDKAGELRAGDYVGVFLKQEAIRPGMLPRMVKRLAMGMMPGIRFPYVEHPNSNVRPLVVLETLNPPRTFAIPITSILAMHRVIGEAEPTGRGARMIARFEDGGARIPLKRAA